MLSKLSMLSFLGIGLILLLVGSAIDIEPKINADFIRGNNCTTHHGSYFLEISAKYEPDSGTSTNGTFYIILSPTSSDLIFSGNVTLITIPFNASIKLGEIKRELSAFSTETKLLWNLNGVTPNNGAFVANITMRVSVPKDYPIHPGHEAIYAVELIYDLNSTKISLFDYFLSLNWVNIDLYNQLLSYLSYGVLAITTILGMPQISALISKNAKINVSNKKIRYYHCLFGKIVAIMISIHVIISTLSPMWFYIIRLWILPTIYLPEDFTLVLRLEDLKFGLELGRWAGVLILIVITSGMYFSRIVNKFDRDWAIFTQQISYLILLLVALHASILGTLAHENLFFVTFIWITLIIVFILRLVIIIFNQGHKVRHINKRKTKEGTDPEKNFF